MKRYVIWLLAAALLLGGCSSAQQDDPFRVDTVVQIPVDPTDAPTEATAEPETKPPTEEPTEKPAETLPQPEETTASKTTTSSKGSGSGKGSSGGSGSSGKNQKKETTPPETEPPVTETVVPETEAPTEPPYDPSSYGIGGLEYALLDELNACRTEAGESELSISGKLSGIAYLRAREAVSSWSHTRPDGRDFTTALSDYGYGYASAVELMIHTSGSCDAAWVSERWLNSDSHRENICSGGFSKVGIGVYRSDGVTYVVCILVG